MGNRNKGRVDDPLNRKEETKVRLQTRQRCIGPSKKESLLEEGAPPREDGEDEGFITHMFNQTTRKKTEEGEGGEKNSTPKAK